MYSRFMFHPKGMYRDAVRVLRELLAEQGTDAVQRACADAISAALREGYIRRHQLEPKRGGHVCIHRLMGRRCPTDGSHLQIPGEDHLSEWRKDRQTVLIISQPYHFTYDTMKKTIAFCEAHGLTANVEAYPSWHFPGAVLTIEYRRAEKKGPALQVEIVELAE